MVANLKKLRTERGFSQERLASMIGITQQAVYKYENLSVEPDIQTLIQLADLFGVSVDYLIGRTDFLVGSENDKAILTISPAEAEHINIWRRLPFSLRSELDGIISKYNITPVYPSKRTGSAASEEKR